MRGIHNMPVLFLGHGSPMNALEDNEFTQGWAGIAGKLPRPRNISCLYCMFWP